MKPSCWTTRDLSAMRACEIVKPEEAAVSIGRKLLNEPLGGFPNCVYVVERPNGSAESYCLVFTSVSLQAAYMDFLTEEGKSEEVNRLWDGAYVSPRDFGEGYQLVVLKRGDLAFEASRERKEPLRRSRGSWSRGLRPVERTHEKDRGRSVLVRGDRLGSAAV